jgi:hypothetical protein
VGAALAALFFDLLLWVYFPGPGSKAKTREKQPQTQSQQAPQAIKKQPTP